MFKASKTKQLSFNLLCLPSTWLIPNSMRATYNAFLVSSFTTHIEKSDYIKSTASSPAWKVGSLCLTRFFSRQKTSCAFKNLLFVHALNNITFSGRVLLLYISGFLTTSKEGSIMQSILIRHLFICYFLTDVTWIPTIFSTNIVIANVLASFFLPPEP